VSRWWPERVSIRVGATAGSRAPAMSPQARIDAMLEEFERELESRALPARTPLTVVLGGEAMRYRIVASSDASAAQSFEGAAADAARDWIVRMHPAAPGEATLASAADAVLLDRLQAAARSRHLKLDSVQPALTHAYNTHRRRLPAQTWFAWLEHGWYTLLLTSPRGPRHVRHAFDDRVDLQALIARASFTLGLDDLDAPLHVARLHQAPEGSLAGSPPDPRAPIELPPLEDAPIRGGPHDEQPRIAATA